MRQLILVTRGQWYMQWSTHDSTGRCPHMMHIQPLCTWKRRILLLVRTVLLHRVAQN